MLIQKKEQFRQEIRKQGLEEIFNQNRKKLMLGNVIQQYSDEIIDEIVPLFDQIEEDQNFNISKFSLLKSTLEGNLTNQKIMLLQLILKKYKDAQQIENIEKLFEDYNLGSRILSMCQKEQNLVYLDELLYLLGNLSQSSLFCQVRIIQLKIVQCLKNIIDVQNELDDNILSTIMFLITTFVEPNSRIPFQNIQQFMLILDQLCEKLRGLNYFDTELDLENKKNYSETKQSLLNRILLFARYYIDKSQSSSNLTLYQNFWILLTTIAFVVQSQYQLRLVALQVISDSMKLNYQQLKKNIIEKYPDIFFQLFNLIDYHKKNNKKIDKCIRIQALIIIKQLFFEQSQQIIQNIHLNQIPLQILLLVEREKNHQILYHQLEVLFLLCSNSTFEQCINLYHHGLLFLLITLYQKIKEQQDYVLCKQLIKLTFAILQHNQSNNNIILNFLKQYQITSYLNFIIINCKHQKTCKRANQLFKYIQ